jgi:DNA-directed RNA polymerase subunit K/omega
MEAKELEGLLAKAGGKFKLVSLFQRRMRELQRGLPRLVQTDSINLWEIVSKELHDGKVDLIIGEEAEVLRKEAAAREAEEMASEADKAKQLKPAETPKP